MADVVTPEVRSRMMAGIRGKNTKPEMIIRRGLHAMGFRYKLHHKGLPGRPDLVFPRYKAVVFVHGCFWHKHDCRYFKWPNTRPEFWQKKIVDNRRRDDCNVKALASSGWRVAIVWECATKNSHSELAVSALADWLLSNENTYESVTR